MSCSKWRLDISANIDGFLENAKVPAVQKHLEECAECSSFCAEQRELNQLFESTFTDREPSAGIWQRIEVQLTSGTTVPPAPRLRRLLDLFRMPRVGYATAALAVVLMGALVVFERPGIGGEEDRYLAELDAFTIEIEGNPFLRDVQAENPFLSLGHFEAENPFERLGGSKQ